MTLQKVLTFNVELAAIDIHEVAVHIAVRSDVDKEIGQRRLIIMKREIEQLVWNWPDELAPMTRRMANGRIGLLLTGVLRLLWELRLESVTSMQLRNRLRIWRGRIAAETQVSALALDALLWRHGHGDDLQRLWATASEGVTRMHFNLIDFILDGG